MSGPSRSNGDDTPRDQPWWASGAPPEDGMDADEDAFEQHRRARAGDAGHRGGHRQAGEPDGDAGGPGRSAGPGAGWWEAYEVLGRLAREATRGGARHGQGEMCHLCPICTGLRLLSDVRPEVINHLTEATRHLTLAAKAVVDAQADAMHTDDGLQHIDLDDE